MTVHISGGRGDGADWPEAGGIIELGDDEAADVVRAQLGRYAPEARAPETDVETRTVTEKPAGAPAGDKPSRAAAARQRAAAGGQ